MRLTVRPNRQFPDRFPPAVGGTPCSHLPGYAESRFAGSLSEKRAPNVFLTFRSSVCIPLKSKNGAEAVGFEPTNPCGLPDLFPKLTVLNFRSLMLCPAHGMRCGWDQGLFQKSGICGIRTKAWNRSNPQPNMS